MRTPKWPHQGGPRERGWQGVSYGNCRPPSAQAHESSGDRCLTGEARNHLQLHAALVTLSLANGAQLQPGLPGATCHIPMSGTASRLLSHTHPGQAQAPGLEETFPSPGDLGQHWDHGTFLASCTQAIYGTNENCRLPTGAECCFRRGPEARSGQYGLCGCRCLPSWGSGLCTRPCSLTPYPAADRLSGRGCAPSL